jgi:hypothetical protein
MESGKPMRPGGEGRMGRDGRPGGPPSEEQMEKVRKRVEMVRIWKLTEALDLDEKTASKLFPVLRKYDKKRMQLQREKFKLMRRTRQMESGRAGEKVDAEKLLKQVEKNRAAMMAMEKDQNKELKKVLTPGQMVKYIAFEERFRREMRQMLRESRGQRGGGKREQGMRGPGFEGQRRPRPGYAPEGSGGNGYPEPGERRLQDD